MKEYKELSESTKNRLASTLETLHKSGFTTTQAKKMNDDELRIALNTKAKDMNSQRRLINQLTDDKERRSESVKRAEIKYEKEGYRLEKMKEIHQELTKTAGNTFFAIAYELQIRLNENEKESYKHASQLLKIPESEYDKLESEEVEILKEYGT